MKITGAETLILSAPTGGLDWFSGRLETWDSALVRIKTDASIDGIGEVSQGASAAGAAPGIVECLKPLPSGLDPRNPVHIGETICMIIPCAGPMAAFLLGLLTLWKKCTAYTLAESIRTV